MRNKVHLLGGELSHEGPARSQQLELRIMTWNLKRAVVSMQRNPCQYFHDSVSKGFSGVGMRNAPWDNPAFLPSVSDGAFNAQKDIFKTYLGIGSIVCKCEIHLRKRRLWRFLAVVPHDSHEKELLPWLPNIYVPTVWLRCFRQIQQLESTLCLINWNCCDIDSSELYHDCC